MIKMCNDYLYMKMVEFYPHQMFTIVFMWVIKVISVSTCVTEIINVCMHLGTLSRPMLPLVCLACLWVW